DDLPLETISGEPNNLRVSESAIFGKKGAEVVLERVHAGERVSLRRIRVRKGEYDDDDSTYAIDDPTDRLVVGAVVHRNERDEAFLTELYAKLGAFHGDLVRAPRTLQDVRVLLYWAAVMLDAPLCQGDVK